MRYKAVNDVGAKQRKALSALAHMPQTYVDPRKQ